MSGPVRSVRPPVCSSVRPPRQPFTLGCPFSFPFTRVSLPPKTTFMTKHGLIPSNSGLRIPQRSPRKTSELWHRDGSRGGEEEVVGGEDEEEEQKD